MKIRILYIVSVFQILVSKISHIFEYMSVYMFVSLFLIKSKLEGWCKGCRGVIASRQAGRQAERVIYAGVALPRWLASSFLDPSPSTLDSGGN